MIIIRIIIIMCQSKYRVCRKYQGLNSRVLLSDLSVQLHCFNNQNSAWSESAFFACFLLLFYSLFLLIFLLHSGSSLSLYPTVSKFLFLLNLMLYFVIYFGDNGSILYLRLIVGKTDRTYFFFFCFIFQELHTCVCLSVCLSVFTSCGGTCFFQTRKNRFI